MYSPYSVVVQLTCQDMRGNAGVAHILPEGLYFPSQVTTAESLSFQISISLPPIRYLLSEGFLSGFSLGGVPGEFPLHRGWVATRRPRLLNPSCSVGRLANV